MNAGAKIDFDVTQTSGKDGLGLPVSAQLSVGASREHFPYRHFGTRVKAAVRYGLHLYGSDGRLKWAEDFENMVVIAGLDKLLDATFKTGLGAPAWFVGLVDGVGSPVYNPSDTMASHTGWTENEDISEGTRPAFVPGAIAGGSIDNVASRAIFTLTENGAIAGCFMTDNEVIGGTDGTLYGVGGFNGGLRPVEDGDILHVAATLSVAAAD